MDAQFQNEKSSLEFCTNCGAILPIHLIENIKSIMECVNCKQKTSVKSLNGISAFHRVVFNQRDQVYLKESKNKGPIVERQCKNCPSNEMYYFTLQIRSADEGQTVFYTCCKCGVQENENS